ncbi:metal-dependent hydrolase [Candidatus Uhrbacteria bacterium]|nr:metal-dependent hydrolase [Candidatus Uhrbacteria bacterium]
MDPLTHTLVGATLASTRLRDTTRLATAALVIGANLPDVDSILYFTGHDDLALGFRRGWTHGVLALVVLPFLQTALLLAYARITRRQVHARALFGLSTLAILTHPFLDWLNNYGMRWLMPFDGRWFYGDSVFIMDPWLWLILGIGWIAPRRATRTTIAIFATATLLLAYVVGQRSMPYLGVVAAVAWILFLVLLWRPGVQWIPTAALVLAVTYIGARLVIHEITERKLVRTFASTNIMASPNPIDPLRWDFVAQTGDVYRYGRFHWIHGTTVAPEPLPVANASPEYDRARHDPSIRGFMTWVRFPWYEIERTPTRTRVLIHDARYVVRRRVGGGFGGVEVILPAQHAAPQP